MILEPVERLCAERGLPLTPQALDRYALYIKLLEQFNQSMNLIGPMAPDEIVEFLITDSLMAACALAPTASILDVGSGAGLPGIPLKILYPELPITFVEPRQKRANFIKIAAQRLKLDDVTIHAQRLEDLQLTPHSYVISKAFQPPRRWIHTAAPHRADGGHVLCMTRALELDGLLEEAAALQLTLTSWASHFEAPRDDNRVVYAFG